MKVLDRSYGDLSNLLRGRGLAETQAVEDFNAAMRENGLLATSTLSLSSDMIPVKLPAKIQATEAQQALARFRSGEYAVWLLSQPEPTPEELKRILSARNGLGNLRQHLATSATLGPRRRRGGRPKIIKDPAVRQKIRDTIKSLRDPRENLETLFKQIAKEYNARPANIKAIWLEKPGGADAAE